MICLEKEENNNRLQIKVKHQVLQQSKEDVPDSDIKILVPNLTLSRLVHPLD